MLTYILDPTIGIISGPKVFGCVYIMLVCRGVSVVQCAYAWICACECIFKYIYVCMYVSACMSMHEYILCVYGCVLQRCGLARAVRTRTRGPDPIRIRVHCGPNTLANRRLTHG